MAFTSSAGQTYLIGVFGPQIQDAFALSHTQWATMYMIGTLSSALVLLWSGQLIDKIDLRVYVFLSVAGLVGACLVMSLADSVILVTVAIFLLRHFGQGLTSHAGVTSMARYYGHNRGKAIAIFSTGFSAGEAVLPVLVVVAIATWGWRFSYGMVGLGVLLLIPIVMWLLKGQRLRHQNYLAMDNDHSNQSVPDTNLDRNRRQVLREIRFWLIAPAIIAPALVMTAMFFHHLNLAESKGWAPAWVTGSYWLYALTSVVVSLTSGPLIDRFSARRVIPYYLVPLSIGLICLSFAEASLWVLPYMFLMGLTTGLFFTGLSALWAELYGRKFLGAIKSMVSSFSVFSSALGPVIVGIMLDSGFTIENVCLGFATGCIVATVLLVYALKLPARNLDQQNHLASNRPS